MGKVRFKVSYGVPQGWCYEPREVGGTHTVGQTKAANHGFACKTADKRVPRHQASICSTSDRAIGFSSGEMQRGRSSSCADSVGVATRKSQKGKGIAICTVVDPRVSAGCTCRVSSVVSLRKAKGIKVQSCTSDTSIWSGKARLSNRGERLSCCVSKHNAGSTMGSGTYAKTNKDIYDASEPKRTSCDNGICFDARELERRLRALGFEERRTYYTEWSSGFSSPEIDRITGDAPREEEIKSTRHDPHIVSKLFDKFSSNESNFRLTTSPSGNELDCGTSSVGNNEFSSLTSDESLFTTTDEIHSPMLRCLCGLSGKEHTCSVNGVGISNPFLGAEISNGVFQGRKMDAARQKSHDKTILGSRYSKSKESNVKRGREFAKRSQLVYHETANSPEDFVNCLPQMKSGSEPSENHIFNRGGGTGSTEFYYGDCKARNISGKSTPEDFSGFTPIESGPEFFGKQHRRASQVSTAHASHYRDSNLHSRLRSLSHNESESTLARQQENSRNILFSDFLIGEMPSSQSFGTRDKSELISTAEIMKGVHQLHWHGGTMGVMTQKEGNDPQEVSPDVYSRVYDSFAMVKCSTDPLKDFKDSMREMVIEKELHTSEDLEDLLECYLSLNSEGYHDKIVRAFGEVSTEIFQG